jgi:hypothetical protein
MLKISKNIIIALSILFLSNIAYANHDISNTAIATKNDTICYKYHFNPGDTLIYNVVSYDSVIIDYSDPLLKTRFEKILIICDSVKNDKYFLSQQLIDFISYESTKDTQKVKRTENPWIGRKVWFGIDSLGNRFALGYDDSTKAALTPGGAFQPHLIFPLQQSCKKIDETWIAGSLDELVENGFPLPLVNQTSLFRALEPVDTLNRSCNRLSYIKTAQGSYNLKSEQDTIRVTNIITGYGIMDFCTQLHIPVHYHTTIEQKLTITVADKQPQQGWHYIASFFTLESYKQAKQQNKK